MAHSPSAWLIFAIVIIALLVFDLSYLNKKEEAISFRRSLLLSAFYITIACLFGVYIYYMMGADRTREYFTGFLIEKAMALDNVFIFSLIFTCFAIPLKVQHRVLFWGIVGVIIFRGIMIGVGSRLINDYSWILYIFAIILIVTGIKILILTNKQFNVQDSHIYKLLVKHLNITPEMNRGFFVVIKNKLYVTPLFLALVLIETMDIVFAIDSLPAIFAVTNDSYIIYTSNIFAILGLRALYFCLSDIVERFKYVKYSLGLILIFIGFKIFADYFTHVPAYVSLLVTIMLLSGGISASLAVKKS